MKVSFIADYKDIAVTGIPIKDSEGQIIFTVIRKSGFQGKHFMRITSF